MRAFLAGDIDGIIREFENLTGMEDLPGAIGEFGLMIKEAVSDGVDWMRDMIEVLRRTPVLNLMVNTAMRCILLMTPNFWAKVLGEGVGFIIPELLIWIVATLIAGLSAGAGATVLAVRCANIASKIRKAIKGSAHVGKMLSFLDELKPIFDKIGDLGKKLRQSIEEIKSGIVNGSQRVVRSARYWRTRLDDLAGQGHGPQKHEGDVTDTQLFDRVLLGKDPLTNTVRRNDKGKIIGVGKHSTKFNTPADYVRAYDKALEHPDYIEFAKSTDLRREIPMKMSEVFEGGFQARIKGYSITSGKVGQNPTIAPTVFGPDTQIIARFRRENGVIKLTTMYPNP